MSGRSDDSGQLALLDAIVFFVVAIGVSGMLFSMVSETGDIEPISGSWFDAGTTLDAFLQSSLGSETQVTIHGETVELPERTEITECILLEAHTIAEGDGGSDFSDLNLKLAGILEALSEPSMRMGLLVFEPSNGTLTDLFSIVGYCPETRTAFAATATVADSEGRSYEVQLWSAPSAVP